MCSKLDKGTPEYELITIPPVKLGKKVQLATCNRVDPKSFG